MKLDRYKIEIAAFKAEKIFGVMSWTWSVRNHKRVKPYVPNYLDITETLIRLSKDVGGATVCSATGRLVARLVRDEEGDYICYYVSL